MRTGSLFRGERRHEAGERLQGHRWHGAGGSHLSLQRVALSSPAGGRAAFCSSARRASPSSRRAPPPLPPRPALPASPSVPEEPLGPPCPAPEPLGSLPRPPLGKRRCGGWALEEQPLQCFSEVAPPLPGHARKNYSRPGICSGRAELKSLSWAWQPSQRSRQLFQGQPWRVQSSRLTLREEEEPCSAGTGPAPLSSCRAAGWRGHGGGHRWVCGRVTGWGMLPPNTPSCGRSLLGLSVRCWAQDVSTCTPGLMVARGAAGMLAPGR